MVEINCPTCDGIGEVAGKFLDSNSGKHIDRWEDPAYDYEVWSCPHCDGKGELSIKPGEVVQSMNLKQYFASLEDEWDSYDPLDDIF